MRQITKIVPLFVLAALMLIAGIAATPGALAKPVTPTVFATANAGELQIGWSSIAGAQHYTVGWANLDELLQMGDEGRSPWDAVYFTTISADYTSHTLSGLKPNTEYYVRVGVQTKRFNATDQVWGDWAAPVKTAGQHGDGFCPITGLPIPTGGYLSIGNSTTDSSGNVFTLDSVTKQVMRHSFGRDHAPNSGRQFIKVCGTIQVSGFIAYVSSAHDYNLDTDAGIGFRETDTSVTDWADVGLLGTGVTASACEIWDIPANANTVIVAINNGQNNPGLYRVDLNNGTFTPTPTPATPLTNQQLMRHVKPALGQIVATNSAGETVGGTGFVVRSSGLMVTNRHLVDDVQTVTVRMNTLDGQTLNLTGNVRGRGILADLAVVQLPAGRTYATLPLADSDAISGLDEVSAWGYPGGSISGTYPTVTRGVISSKGIYGDVDFLQTDAAINPGNSGGPLVDQYGRVGGVNTMKTIGDAVDNQGFAIASNEVSNRLNTLINGGRASETYQNVKHGHGYSINIPKGWYLLDESGFAGGCTAFAPYHREGSASLCAYHASSFASSSDKLAAFAEWKRNDLVQRIQAGNRNLFEPVSFTRVTIDGRNFYRLEYRYQGTLETCIENRIMLMGLSSASPEHYGFTWRVGVCEQRLNQYSAERQAMLNSFRP